MPFEGIERTTTTTTTEDLSYAPGREGLRRLAILLRREMPKNFHWNFKTVFVENTLPTEGFVFPVGINDLLSEHSCGTMGCALGLGAVVWPEFRKAVVVPWKFEGCGPSHLDSQLDLCARVATHFHIPSIVAQLIFFSNELYGVSHLRDVTPGMVADAIEYYLKHKAVPPLPPIFGGFSVGYGYVK